MKTPQSVYAIVSAALLFGTNAAYADEGKDRVLERRIHAAVAPVAQKMKLLGDTGPNVDNDASVNYTNERGCDGTSYCTVMVVYYDKQQNCQRAFMGKQGFQRGTGKGRDIYNLKHKNVCYQISVNGKRNAQAVADALKAKM